MKIMSRDFTTKEKVLLLILAAILILAGYYLFVDQPVRSALDSAKSQQEELNTELVVLQSRAASLSSMRANWMISKKAESWERWEATTTPKLSWMS